MPPTVRALIARNLRHQKTQSGMTWDEIAAKAKVSQRAVYRWANDEGSRPDDANLQRLARLFDVTAGYFLEDNKESRHA